MPASTAFPESRFAEGVDILTVLTEAGLVSSRSEGRRLIQQGGVHLADERVEDMERVVTLADFTDGEPIFTQREENVPQDYDSITFST